VNTKQEALLDELLKDYTSPQDILGEHGLLKQLTKRVVERVLERTFRTPLELLDSILVIF
jgi:putative transposase